MRTHLSTAGILLALASGTVALARQASPAPLPEQASAGATISGTIVTTGSPAFPIRHARVVLSSDTYWRAVLTEDDGKFVFRDLLPQRYKLEASKPAYITTEFGGAKLNGGGTRIELATGQHMSDVVMKLAGGAVLSGTIRDTAGAPAADVAVVARSNGLSFPAYTNFRGSTASSGYCRATMC